MDRPGSDSYWAGGCSSGAGRRRGQGAGQVLGVGAGGHREAWEGRVEGVGSWGFQSCGVRCGVWREVISGRLLTYPYCGLRLSCAWSGSVSSIFLLVSKAFKMYGILHTPYNTQGFPSNWKVVQVAYRRGTNTAATRASESGGCLVPGALGYKPIGATH